MIIVHLTLDSSVTTYGVVQDEKIKNLDLKLLNDTIHIFYS